MIGSKVTMFGNEEVKSWAQALFLGMFYTSLFFLTGVLVVYLLDFVLGIFGPGVTVLFLLFVLSVSFITYLCKDGGTQERTDEHPPL